MALVSCPECGHSVSSEAISCPNCGYPLQNKKEDVQCILFVNHLAGVGGAFRKTIVFIDGQVACIQKERDENKLLLTPGEHKIDLYIKEHLIKSVNMTFTETQPVGYLDYRYTMGWSTPGIMIVRCKTDSAETVPACAKDISNSVKHCPKCGSPMTIQAVSETKKVGCLSFLWYAFLFVSILGWLVLIPLLINRKKTVKYAVCQKCGYSTRVN